MKPKWYVPWLYILPALVVLGVFLVYPALQTIIVSFFNHYYRPTQTFVGFQNYLDVFKDKAMGVAFRNNALWLVLMTSVTVGMGLLLAVLLDRVRYEALAKSIIFLPMAISFTAASVIWRFVYAYRPPSRPQIGLLNGTLTGLKGLANDPAAHWVLSALLWVFGLLALGLWVVAAIKAVGEARRARQRGGAWGGLAWSLLGGAAGLALYALSGWSALAVLGALLLAVVGAQDRRVGAAFVASLAVALVVQFVLSQADFVPFWWLSKRPWINNVSLIATGIWVWTGFCMVILSAAYKGIPAELLEAARIDGASEWQVFWYITVPFMKSTLAVVTTTIIIFVLKTFDIVYVMTNGNYGTEVLANYMIRTMYSFPPAYGKASVIALVLMVLIVPFIVINLRRFRAQEAMR